MTQIITEAVDITPEMAAVALSNRRKNRKPKPAAIAKYADDMREGRWRMNGETVTFNAEGQLIDGSNRMHAIVQAGIPVRMLVVKGVDDSAMITINTGVARTFVDHLTINRDDIPNPALVSAVTSRMYRWDVQKEYVSKLAGGFSLQALDEYFDSHTEEILSGAQKTTNTLITPSTLATVKILLRRIDKDQADEFTRQVVTGAIPDENSPVLVLRLRLERDQVSLSYGKRLRNIKQQEIARALCFITWNAWREGKVVSKIQLPKSLEIRYPFPR